MPRLLRNWLDAYLEYTKMSESPTVFHFWTGVSTIAGALKRRVWIEQQQFQWTPNFYIIFVAPAGVVSKSTSMSQGMDLLSEVDGVTMGPPSCTWQALVKRMAEAQEYVPLVPGQLDGELEVMSCVTCAISELGTFLNFQDDKLLSVLTDLWDGKKHIFEHATSSQGTTSIKNPWINMIAATTPAWLKANAPDHMIGGGFASRVVFVYGSQKRHLVAYPGLVKPIHEHQEQRAALLHDLKEISHLWGEMVLSPEAIEIGQAWYAEHWNNRPIEMASERYGGYIARKQSHVHKLAMVLAVSRHEYLAIEGKDLEDAIKIVTATEKDMINVFESVGVAPTARLLQEIVTFLHTYKKEGLAVNSQMLWRHCMSIMNAQEFSEVTNSAVKAGYLEIRDTGSGVYYNLLVDPADINGGVRSQ